MMKLGRALIGLAFLYHVAAAPAWAHAQTNASVVDRQVTAALDRVANDDGPGAVILISKNGSSLLLKARGRAEVELGVALRPDHVFRIASVTKIFTAALVLKLAEQGDISLDGPLSQALPDFPRAEAITIRQLLSHTAGLSDKALFSSPQPGFLRTDIDLASLVKIIAAQPLRFEPGSSQIYSNSGYIVLGAVIEKVTGQPWYEALREQLLEPLGLRNTGYGDAATIIPKRVAGYSKQGGVTVVNGDFV